MGEEHAYRGKKLIRDRKGGMEGDVRARVLLPLELIRPFILNGMPNARAISQPFWGWKRHAHSTTKPARLPDWFSETGIWG